MNTNKYELDSTDEMLKLYDFHFDQNIPVQGPEAQALEAQEPEAQALEAQGPENQAPEAQGPENQAPEAQGLEAQAPDDSSRAIDQLLMVGMSLADAKNAMMDETLAKSAISDPTSVKRKWANRLSAARSKKRKAENVAELETRVKTLQTQKAALADREALCMKDVDALKHERAQLWSTVKFIEQQNLTLYSQNANLRIKAGQVDPNSGPPGMMMPSGVPHNNFAPNPHQQATQAHARMQQQQQPQLVLPSRTNVASGEGADAAGSDTGGGDDAPGQGP